MRIFVAGATGVIGRRVVPLLLADGHVVAGMTRSDHQAVAHLGAEPVTVRKLMARVADGEVPRERGQRPVVEHVGDEAHVLDDGDVLVVADRHARRLLAAVLEGVEPEVGHVGDRLARCVDAEDAARLLGRVVVGVPDVVGDRTRRTHDVHHRTPPSKIHTSAP